MNGFLLPFKEQVASLQTLNKKMQFLTIEDKRSTIDAVSFFLSTLKTQNVKDSTRIGEYENLLSKLQLDLSKHTL